MEGGDVEGDRGGAVDTAVSALVTDTSSASVCWCDGGGAVVWSEGGVDFDRRGSDVLVGIVDDACSSCSGGGTEGDVPYVGVGRFLAMYFCVVWL